MGCSRRNPAIRVTPQSEIGRLFENRQQAATAAQGESWVVHQRRHSYWDSFGGGSWDPLV